MFLSLANRQVITLSALLTVSLLFILGISGLFYIIKYKNNLAEEIPESLISWYDLIKFVDILLIIAFVVRIYIFQPYIVEGKSMEPAFSGNEFLLVDRLSYRIHKPNRGDIVIFHPKLNGRISELSYIKRIIGLPGETVKISFGKVYINNKIINEPYLNGINTTTEDPQSLSQETALKENEFFVMGDNRSNSSDSRIIGPVDFSEFVGRAMVVLYPFDKIGVINH